MLRRAGEVKVGGDESRPLTISRTARSIFSKCSAVALFSEHLCAQDKAIRVDPAGPRIHSGQGPGHEALPISIRGLMGVIAPWPVTTA